jgi:hypothetical protein
LQTPPEDFSASFKKLFDRSFKMKENLKTNYMHREWLNPKVTSSHVAEHSIYNQFLLLKKVVTKRAMLT